jgi:hypothetical protein
LLRPFNKLKGGDCAGFFIYPLSGGRRSFFVQVVKKKAKPFLAENMG